MSEQTPIYSPGKRDLTTCSHRGAPWDHRGKASVAEDSGGTGCRLRRLHRGTRSAELGEGEHGNLCWLPGGGQGWTTARRPDVTTKAQAFARGGQADKTKGPKEARLTTKAMKARGRRRAQGRSCGGAGWGLGGEVERPCLPGAPGGPWPPHSSPRLCARDRHFTGTGTWAQHTSWAWAG